MESSVVSRPVRVGRAEFLALWRGRHDRLRHAVAVDALLRDDHDGTLEGYLREDALETRRRHRLEERRLPAFRASMKGVSPLLVAACASEGVSLAAVAYGVLPEARKALDDEGPPWRRNEILRRSARGARSFPSWLDRWQQGHLRNAAVVRAPSHPAGRWGVRLSAGILHVDMDVDDFTLRSGGRHCTLTLRASLPEAALAGLRGRPVSALLEHPMLADGRYLITSAVARDGLLTVRFRCPPEPLRLADLRPEAGMEHQQLGRDGSLSGLPAVGDLLRRCAASLRRPDRLSRRRGLVSPEQVWEMAVEQVRKLNLMTPPWGERIEVPTPEMVLAFMGVRRDG